MAAWGFRGFVFPSAGGLAVLADDPGTAGTVASGSAVTVPGAAASPVGVPEASEVAIAAGVRSDRGTG